MTTEPSDIVESTPENLPDRLMAYHEMGKQKPHVLMMAPLVEAAAEITRLRAALAAEREAQVMDNLHEQDLRYSWMQNPNGRGIAYFNGVLHTSGVELSNEVRAMLLEEFAAVEARALAAERERCARVAEEMAVLAQSLASATENNHMRDQRIAESAQSLSIAAAIRSITP